MATCQDDQVGGLRPFGWLGVYDVTGACAHPAVLSDHGDLSGRGWPVDFRASRVGSVDHVQDRRQPGFEHAVNT
jgi:hypothetical protein